MTYVTIIVLTFNRCELLKELMIELSRLTYKSLEIIVVDNHSTDGTERLIQTEFPQICYIRTAANLGASARNFGMERAGGDILLTLDDDVRGINDMDILKIDKLFKARPKLAAVNFKVIDHQTRRICNWVHHCRAEQFGDREFATYEITEGAVAFRRSALDQAGYYPDSFFLSHEGPDLAFRLIDRGYDVIYSPCIEVIHCHSHLGRRSWLNYYYDSRNQLWLAVRNFPASYAAIYLARGLVSMMVYSIRDRYFKYWLRGVADGLMGIGTVWAQRRVLKKKTVCRIRALDKNRPSLGYMIKTRLLKKGVRL